MGAIDLDVGQHKPGQCFQGLHQTNTVPGVCSDRRYVSPGVLYAHALAIEREAETRCREFAAFMAGWGNDGTADLFNQLAAIEAQYASRVMKKSAGIEIPVIESGEFSWLDSGAPVPEARALVFRTMTPRLALEIAQSAKEQAKAFFLRVWADTRNAGVRELASELAQDEDLQLASVKDALARLPRPLLSAGEPMGDPTLEQQL